MSKFNNIKKLNLLNSVIISIKYLLWIVFFIFQGRAIELAVTKKEIFDQLMISLVLFVTLKMFVVLCDALQSFILEYFKNIAMNEQWQTHFPKKIYRDMINKDNEVNLLFLDYFPALYDINSTLFSNNFTLITIFSFTILAFLYEGFSFGIISLPVVFFMNFFSKKIYVRKINQLNTVLFNTKSQALEWIKQYFMAYKEISKIWHNKILSLWSIEVYKPYFESTKKQTILVLYRDIITHFFVEFPFMINSAVIIVAVYYGYLSLEEMFVWIGFCQFMIQASNNYIQNQIAKEKNHIIKEKIDEILNHFRQPNTHLFSNTLIKKIDECVVTMKDGTKNILGIKPKIYLIQGDNGTGKSTLMNLILGHERADIIPDNPKFNQIINLRKSDEIRLIERESVIFNNLLDFNAQICGPITQEARTWRNKAHRTMHHLFDYDLRASWTRIFDNLECEYNNRTEVIFSSGEKVIFSFIRFLASWEPSVSLLIVDECDSFLDRERKILFAKTIQCLAKHMAIYISSHDKEFKNILLNDYAVTKNNPEILPVPG